MSVLLVSSGGGHLKQLHELVPRLGLSDHERLWVTFDTGLSRSLLADEEVVLTRYAAPKDTANILRNAAVALRVLRGRRFDLAVSTGSSLAVCYLPLAAARGASAHFIETAARAAGPSLTGRLLERVPGVATYTQYERWASPRWVYAGSVFDGYEPGPPVGRDRLRRVVVTLGTTESYGFRRLLEPLVPLLRGVDVLWQTGTTDVTGLGITAHTTVPSRDLVAAMREADLVVAHAGTGAALTALELGKVPLLVPRRARHGEHVDDHQLEIAEELAGRGLARWSDPERLDHELLLDTAALTVVPVAAPQPFRLLEREDSATV